MSLQRLIGDVQIAADKVSSGQPEAHSELQRAIRSLNIAAETPAQTLSRILYQPVQNAVIRIAVELGLPGLVAAKEGQAVSVSELSIQSGGSTALIVRLMRVLSALQLCDEAGEGKYKSNALTEALASPAFVGGTKYLYDSFMLTAAKLPQFMQETGFQNPEGNSPAPFEYTFNAHLWTHLAHDAPLQSNMMSYMAGRRKGAARFVDVYPAESQLQGTLRNEEDAVLLVDIGGNQGHDLKLFHQTYSNLSGRLILMDLPEAIENNKSDMTGIEMIPYDFYTPQPIKGARLYLFRAICHDWSDDKCREFLGNTAKAMDKDYSRLLINDYVLPDTGVDLHPALLDIMMMSLCSGLERTEKQWRALLDSIGLEIVKIWTSPGAESVIETKLKV